LAILDPREIVPRSFDQHSARQWDPPRESMIVPLSAINRNRSSLRSRGPSAHASSKTSQPVDSRSTRRAFSSFAASLH
jgi:hypothetical protein